jgi:hypothetical protein
MNQRPWPCPWLHGAVLTSSMTSMNLGIVEHRVRRLGSWGQMTQRFIIFSEKSIYHPNELTSNPPKHLSAANIGLCPFVIGAHRCCHWTWWIIRPALSKPISGWIFVIEQSGQVISSRGQALSEFFCWHLHRHPRGMTLQPALTSVALQRKPVAMGERAPRAPVRH